MDDNDDELCIGMLSRHHCDLLILTVTFLKKLSVYEDNKNVMKSPANNNVLTKVCRFIPCSSQALVNVSLRFLFNMSFDKVSSPHYCSTVGINHPCCDLVLHFLHSQHSVRCQRGARRCVHVHNNHVLFSAGVSRTDDGGWSNTSTRESVEDAMFPRSNDQVAVPPFCR